VVKIALAAALAITAASPPINAHPLHTSLTEIVKDQRSGQVALSIRLFADDFGSALDSLVASSTSGGVTPRDEVARAYFERSVVLQDKDGRAIGLEWCGIRSVDNLTWLCARSEARVPAGKLRIRNSLMFDRFPDQLSIIRWKEKSRTTTRILSSRAPETVLD
jgi:hypothetical protein